MPIFDSHLIIIKKEASFFIIWGIMEYESEGLWGLAFFSQK